MMKLKHFIAHGNGYGAVVSAVDEVEATRGILQLFAAAGVAVVEMSVMEFDPSQPGGVLFPLEEKKT